MGLMTRDTNPDPTHAAAATTRELSAVHVEPAKRCGGGILPQASVLIRAAAASPSDADASHASDASDASDAPAADAADAADAANSADASDASDTDAAAAKLPEVVMPPRVHTPAAAAAAASEEPAAAAAVL